MMKKKKQPKPKGSPQDTDLDVGQSGGGYHDHIITWYNRGTVDEIVDFYSTPGSPFIAPNDKSFVVLAGGIKKTKVQTGASGSYPYKVCPPLAKRTRAGGDPTVIIQ
jgi:hypothetical protein